MGMGTDENDRSQAGRKAMAGQGRGDADRSAGGRAGGGKRTSKPERVEQNPGKLGRLRLNQKRRTNLPSLPSMSKEGSGASKNGKPNAGFGMQSEKSASWNKKSTESKSNGSEKSENGSWN